MKKKYSISVEGVDTLTNTLLNRKAESIDSVVEFNPEGLCNDTITTSFLHKIIKVRDLDDVEKRNDSLTRIYTGYIEMYGFKTMLDMYLFAMSSDPVPVQKGKDYSKLVPVKRKVIRNGKETEVTVWVKPNGDEKDDREETEKQPRTSAPSKPRHKARLINTKRDANKTKKIKEDLPNLPDGNLGKYDPHHYILITGEGGETVGVVSIVEQGNYLKMEGYRFKRELVEEGFAKNCFIQTVLYAAKMGRGVIMDDVASNDARHVFQMAGLEKQSNGHWQIEPDKLKSLVSGDGEAR